MLAEVRGASWAPNGARVIDVPDAPAAANKNTKTNGAAAALAGKSEADIRIAANDTAKALMMIRAYRIRGHLEADLDPLNLVKQAPHRELDPELSLPYRPYHRHVRRLYLTSGEIVRVDVEIWPTSMVFRKGHRIRLDIQPRDGVGSASYMHYHADYNSGTNTIHAGGDKESYLLLPIIPMANP